jgi:predicted transcriptional regulator
MKKAVTYKLDQQVLDIIDKMAEEKKWSKVAIIETSVKEFYEKNKVENKQQEAQKSTIKVGDKYFKVTMYTSVEIGECGDIGIGIDRIYADEDIKFEEFIYKKGQLIYDNDSEDENLSNINKTILVYQNYDDIPD